MSRYVAVLVCLGILLPMLSFLSGADPEPADGRASSEKTPAPPGEGDKVAATAPCELPEELTEPHVLDVQEQALERKFRKRITTRFQDIALRDVLKVLGEMSELPIIIDEVGIRESGIALQEVLEERVTLSLRDIRVKEVFSRVLQDHRLVAVLKDESIGITTTGCFVDEVKMHPIADLVACRGADQTDVVQAELSLLIRQVVAPETWREVGGTGAIEYNPLTLSFVIRQDSDVHDAIADMLRALRLERCRAKELLGATGGPTIAEIDVSQKSLAATRAELTRLEQKVHRLEEIDTSTVRVREGTFFGPVDAVELPGAAGRFGAAGSLTQLAADARQIALRSLQVALKFEREMETRRQKPAP